MKYFFQSILIGSFILAASLTMADPPPWAPAHGWRAKHAYYYYPSQQVYFSPEQQRYFWLEGSAWRVGIQLPNWIILGPKVTVDLDTTKPYTQHSYIKGQYPPK